MSIWVTNTKAKERNVVLSWSDFCVSCKSRWSALARSLFLSRQRLRDQVTDLREQLTESEAQRRRAAAEAERAREESEHRATRIAELEAEL